MGHEKKKTLPIITRVVDSVLPPGESLSENQGYWRETKFYFVRKNPEIPDSFYYHDLSFEFQDRQEFGHSGLYDKEAMDAEFRIYPHVTYLVLPLRDEANVPEMDEVFCSVFHLDASFEWRWPEPHEKVYHRPGDGYVGIWLEHLRSGFHPRRHQLLKHLCKYEYGILIMQLMPNAVKWIIWFLGTCNTQGTYLLSNFSIIYLGLFILTISRFMSCIFGVRSAVMVMGTLDR